MNLPPGASPLPAAVCLNCLSNGIPDQLAAGRFRGIGLSPILRWVPLCRPCLQIFHGFTQLIEQGEPLTDAECAEFLGVTTDFQVSGEDEDDRKEAQGAAPETRIPPQPSVEPPGLFPASKTAPKALQAADKPPKPAEVGTLGGTRKPRMTLPKDWDPVRYIRCLEHPERGWLLRGSWQSHVYNCHKGLHAHQVSSEPKLDFVCPDESRDGCHASFSTRPGFKKHIEGGHPWATQSARAAI